MRPLLVVIFILSPTQCWAQPASNAEAATIAPPVKEKVGPPSPPLTEEDRVKLKLEELKQKRKDLLKQALKSTKSMRVDAKHIQEVLKESARLLKEQKELLTVPLGEGNGR